MSGLGKYQWIDYDEQTSKNYQAAINYYNQRTTIILNGLLAQINSKLIEKGQQQFSSTEDLILAMSEGLDNFITNWEQFYNSKPDITKFKKFAQQYNELMQEDNKQTEQIMARAQIVKLLIQNEIITLQIFLQFRQILMLQQVGLAILVIERILCLKYLNKAVDILLDLLEIF